VRKLLAALAITTVALATPSLADEFSQYELIRGKIKHEYGHTIIVLALKNNSVRTVTQVFVNCGFYRGDELVDSGHTSFTSVRPNQTGYDEALGDGEDITRVDCRIESVTP
jgi:hypothetical protein